MTEFDPSTLSNEALMPEPELAAEMDLTLQQILEQSTPAGNRDEFFGKLREDNLALTYSQIRIRNERISDVLWADVDISGKLSRNYPAVHPIIASPMTTVTGAKMAIAMAELGGAGAIPHSYTPEEQRAMLREVKHQYKTKINDPITANVGETLGTVLRQIEASDAKPTTLPVKDQDGRFAGLLTRTQFDLYSNEPDMLVDGAMIPAEKVVTSDPNTNAREAYEIMRKNNIKTLPLVDGQTQVIKGMYLFGDVKRAVEGTVHTVDAFGRLVTAASVSTFADDAVDRIKFIEKYADIVIMDTSHGELKHALRSYQILRHAIKVIRQAREETSNLDIIIGNISDPNTAALIARLEPDGVRIGQGPGGICISGEVLGGGCPQATAVYECAKAIKGVDEDIAVIADGGISGPADNTKARALGADAAMVGGLVAATDEAEAEEVTLPNGEKRKAYNGEGSATEQKRSLAGKHRYGDADDTQPIFVEGVEKLIPVKGPVRNIFTNAIIGMKKQMSASGFKNVEEMQRGVSFWKVESEAIAAAGASK